ncbi:EFR1 family ferrodoxin [Phocaeicola sp. HCN-6420]|uniref:EFR1 family ferrodoxin n=1 Tax=Phocaeicola sp. HCN-6420 TaxID=3134673 RepID=UPI0030BBF9BD
MIFYFSGTGNSRWVAERLGELLEETVCSIADILAKKNSFVAEENTIGIVFPVYSWGPPAVVLRFIAELQTICKPEYVYFVCTCGDDTGKTPQLIRRAFERKGWICSAGFSVIMPNTYVALPGFDVDPLPVAQEKLKKAEDRVKEIACKLAAHEHLMDCCEGSLPWVKTYIVHPLFAHFLVSAKPFRATEACISCGKCEAVCPLHNIRLTDGKPEWGNHCAMCLACYHHCPKHAIEYAKVTRKKGQYVFTKIKGK